MSSEHRFDGSSPGLEVLIRENRSGRSEDPQNGYVAGRDLGQHVMAGPIGTGQRGRRLQSDDESGQLLLRRAEPIERCSLRRQL